MKTNSLKKLALNVAARPVFQDNTLKGEIANLDGPVVRDSG